MSMTDLDEIIEVFVKTSTTSEMRTLFNDMFTEREKYDFALRWRLMKDLYEGKSQREIARDLGISLCKITRGSKLLKQEGSQMMQILKEYHNE